MREVKQTNRDVNKVEGFGSGKKTVNSSIDTSDIITWSKAPYIPNSGMIPTINIFIVFFILDKNIILKMIEISKLLSGIR